MYKPSAITRELRKVFSQYGLLNRQIRLLKNNNLVEIGLKILNPIQPTAKDMDLGELKKTYGNKLAFFGGVDMQNVLPFGTMKEVEEEVKLRIRQVGYGGGFIIASVEVEHASAQPKGSALTTCP